jgi:hypothetical protein
MKVVLHESLLPSDLRKMMVFQKSQDAAAPKRREKKKELKNPNNGMIREETPVDTSQIEMIRLI